MKTYFVQVVFNNNGEMITGTRYLSAVIQAIDEEHAEKKILEHYNQYYTGGDKGKFYVQCNWRIDIPTREIIEKHWKKANSIGVLRNGEGRNGLHYFPVDTTKKEALSTWDHCNCAWASPSVYYSPEHGGYMVQLHNHMVLVSDFILFKGSTKEVYDKAMKFVKDNSFKEDYYIPFKI